MSCLGGGEHEPWFTRLVATTIVRVECNCAVCGEELSVSYEPLTDSERDWNSRANALKAAFPALSAGERLRLLRRLVGAEAS